MRNNDKYKKKKIEFIKKSVIALKVALNAIEEYINPGVTTINLNRVAKKGNEKLAAYYKNTIVITKKM